LLKNKPRPTRTGFAAKAAFPANDQGIHKKHY
jgi:hypothetical protein